MKDSKHWFISIYGSIDTSILEIKQKKIKHLFINFKITIINPLHNVNIDNILMKIYFPK